MSVPLLRQALVPGIVGISTYVDFAYQREMQLAATRAAGTSGPINQLRSVTVTLDFHRLIANLRQGRTHEAEAQVAQACVALQAGGADFILVTSGTTSTLIGRAREEVSIPFLELGEAAWSEMEGAGPAGLLATSYAAAGGIFHAPAARRGIALLTPGRGTAARVDEAIFGELVCGQVSAQGVAVFRAALAELAHAGARSVILGNTDLTQVAEDLRASSPVPLVDSALAHARAAARAALSGKLPA